MKLRSDYVTNSSSSSFVVYGIETPDINEKNIDALWKVMLETNKTYAETYGGCYKEEYKALLGTTNVQEKIDYVTENLREIEDVTGLSSVEGGDEFYTGVSPETMRKNYPWLRFGEINEFVARKINDWFQSKFTAEDIRYLELVIYPD